MDGDVQENADFSVSRFIGFVGFRGFSDSRFRV